MTKEVEHIIRNTPAIETHGQYVVGAYYGQGVPVLTVYCVDDERRSIHITIDLVRATMTIIPSLLCKETDTIWSTVVGLLHECGVCSERNRVVYFEDSATLMRGLDRFFELLETV